MSRTPADLASLSRPYRACAVARRAGLQAGDRHFFYRASHGFPKIDLDSVLQIRARFFFAERLFLFPRERIG